MKKILLVIILISAFLLFFFFPVFPSYFTEQKATFWQFQSIDTMKYSRDPSREKLNKPDFDKVIDQQVRDISAVGATHVAIATPYDDEFLPILKRWVSSARKYNLNVWFRGNWSGWEKWFNYELVDRDTHIKKTQKFILDNRNLFENGDIFSACPECENGGPGDPRHNGDVAGYRKFLLDEYQITKNAFKKIGRDVKSNYNSMNADVARLIMDGDTTRGMDGLVVIDHYVSNPEQLADDVIKIAQASGGKVVLGEFGAPIENINGKMTEDEQADWINKAITKLVLIPELDGLNYWVSVGGSTEIWQKNGKAKKAVEIIKAIYSPSQITGVVKNELGDPISKAIIRNQKREVITDSKGNFRLPYLDEVKTLEITAPGYKGSTIKIPSGETMISIVLKKENEDLFFRIRRFLKEL